MLRQYINTFHVSTPNRTILRDLYNRMRDDAGNLKPTADRATRHEVYREALTYHKQNQEFYSSVMSHH